MEWKPGVASAVYRASERSTPRRSSSWMDTSVGVDQVIETVAETVFQENSLIEMYEQVLTRYQSLHTLRSKKINK